MDAACGMAAIIALAAVPLSPVGEWEKIPWRVLMDPREQYLRMPSFLIAEYSMIACALVSLWHARHSGKVRLWFAAWVCGTCNDVFFMFLPFCDNFWQAQATIMLSPRLPLYIVCMYTFLYFACTAAMGLGLPPLAEACAAGIFASIFYGVYDICGARFIWWTWHDSDAAIMERWDGVPVGSSMWILTYTAWFCFLYRWTSGQFQAGQIIDDLRAVLVKFFSKATRRSRVVKILETLKTFVESVQTHLLTSASWRTVAFLGVSCTPLFMVTLGLFSIIGMDAPGKPGARTLVAAYIIFLLVIFAGRHHRSALPRETARASIGRANRILATATWIYFSTFVCIFIFFDPATHVSTGVHQAFSDCGVKAFDIMGFERDEFLCGAGPTQASRNTFRLDAECRERGRQLDSELWHRTFFGAADRRRGLSVYPQSNNAAEEKISWYTVCGVEHGPEQTAAAAIHLLGLSILGVLGFSIALCSRS